MIAMQPVWHFLHMLEGFEFAAFWISFFTLICLTGFFIDYVMQKQGFGPYWNSLFVLGGIWLGLYVRYNYLQSNDIQVRDPYLTIGSILAVTSVMLISVAFVRNRTS